MAPKLCLEEMSNPLLVQGEVLDTIENILDGQYSIVDGNSGASLVVEACSRVVGEGINQILTTIPPAIYPHRALTTEDLYKHLSDQDTTGMFSMPAPCTFTVEFDKNWLIENVVRFNDVYGKIVLPRNSVFKIAGYEFGIHYPIELRVTYRSNTVTAVYDTSDPSPMQSLNSNVVNTWEIPRNGMTFVAVRIDTFQFTRTHIHEEVTPSAGFAKGYDFDDRFFAIAVYNIVNGTRQKVKHTFAADIYHPDEVTATIQVNPETNRFKVEIPQVYFTSGMITGSLEFEVYTTKGAINLDVSNAPSESFGVNYLMSDNEPENTFSSVLNRLTTDIVSPAATLIVGGNNGMSFEEIRQNIIDSSFGTTTLNSPLEIANHFKKSGYTATAYRDDITDRIYLCSRAIEDGDGITIAAADIPAIISDASVEGVGSIRHNIDRSITILPTTLYKFDKDQGGNIPLKDVELAEFETLSKAAQVKAYNTNKYVIAPYLTRLAMKENFPLAYSYDLSNPAVRGIRFVREHAGIASQLVAFSALFTHHIETDGGYDIEIAVNRTADLDELDPATMFKVMAVVSSSNDGVIYGEFTFIEERDTQLIYRFHIDTSYYITEDHRLSFTGFTGTGGSAAHSIPLDFNLDVVFFLGDDAVPVTERSSTIGSDIPVVLSGYVAIARQTLELTSGKLLERVFNRVDVTYTPAVPELYAEDIPLTYTAPEFETNSDGSFVHTIEEIEGENRVVLNKIHEIGETKLDSQGDPIILHRKGTPVVNPISGPVYTTPRKLSYRVDMITVDAKLLKSNSVAHANYLKQVTDQIAAHFSYVDATAKSLLENTKLYFKPIRTYGTGLFKQGNDEEITHELETSMDFKIYVEHFVMQDSAIQDRIRTAIINIVDIHVRSGVISMVTIANDILAELSDTVKKVDVLGINGISTLQTLTKLEDDVRLCIKQRLVLRGDGSITTDRDISVNFVPV